MISAPGPNALGYNGLTERRDGLPAHTYYDPGHFALELQRIWHRNWLYAGRSAELAQPDGKRESARSLSLDHTQDNQPRG